SSRNPGSAQASRKSRSSASSAGTRVSGTNRPPNSPKRPRPVGSGPGGGNDTAGRGGALIAAMLGGPPAGAAGVLASDALVPLPVVEAGRVAAGRPAVARDVGGGAPGRLHEAAQP